jgi:hypothetical protein
LIFFPGILTPNHQSNAKIATTAMTMRRALKRILESMRRQLYGEICQPEANRAIAGERTPPACCFQRRAETPLQPATNTI